MRGGSLTSHKLMPGPRVVTAPYTSLPLTVSREWVSQKYMQQHGASDMIYKLSNPKCSMYIYVWNICIYLQGWLKFMVNAGKYSSHLDSMGIRDT